jgi:hypothetical protein
MASYFDAKNQDDLNLLPTRFRDAEDIAAVAAQVERDILSEFTIRTAGDIRIGDTVFNNNLGLAIYLYGYKEDADDADTDADLKQALKDTVAEVILWRLRRRVHDVAVMAEGDGNKSVTYNDHARDQLFPPNWSFRLHPYDARPPTYL